jgi:hypothetical protein
MTENFMVEFAKEYGLKEGIILSKLCEVMNSKNNNEEFIFSFTLEDLQKWFKYLSEKQIRTGIGNLLNRNGVKRYEDGERNFSRTLNYIVNDKVFVKYLKVLSQGGRGIQMNKKTVARS